MQKQQTRRRRILKNRKGKSRRMRKSRKNTKYLVGGDLNKCYTECDSMHPNKSEARGDCKAECDLDYN